MLKEVKIPEISEGVEEADVAQVLVSKGDKIEQDQGLLELESEKATVELPAPFAGTVKEILVAEGDTVKVEQAVMKLETEGTEEQTTDEPEQKDTHEQTEQMEDKEGTKETEAKETRERQGKAPKEEGWTPQKSKGEDDQTVAKTPPAPPSVRRRARQLGVDLSQIVGSGPGGRITVQDLENQAGGKKEPEEKKTEKTQQTEAEKSNRETGKVEDKSGGAPRTGKSIKMNKIRRITADTMAESWRTIPHVTQFDKTDISWFSRFKAEHGNKVEAGGGKLTITAVILKVTAKALREYPRFNSILDSENEAVILNEDCHIGTAVDTERGLLVPVIRDCDRKSITEIAAELVDKADRARSGKISPEEMKGGCFTISNLGGIGGTAFAPIIYPPQVAILGVSRAAVEPVFVEDEITPRTILPVSLSYDHRVIDGAEGARFLRWICAALAAPLLMELD